MTVNPETGALQLLPSESAHSPTDIDETLERLLELPGRAGGGRRGNRVALILDEFQEVER